jgi:hypothetical protein
MSVVASFRSRGGTGTHPPLLNQPPPEDDPPPTSLCFFFLGLAGRGPLAVIEFGLGAEPKHILVACDCVFYENVFACRVLCRGEEELSGISKLVSPLSGFGKAGYMTLTSLFNSTWPFYVSFLLF